MAIVVLLDQQGSRTAPDHVEAWSSALNRAHGGDLLLPLVRTAGDEMEGAVRHGEALAGIVAASVRDGGWWLGIGLGEIEDPLPASAREGRGPAFWAARTALEKAKSGRQDRPLKVTSEGSPLFDTTAARLDACLGALAYVISRRTDRQQRVADVVLRRGMNSSDVAEELGLSRQGALKQIRAAGCQEEAELRMLAGSLAQDAL